MFETNEITNILTVQVEEILNNIEQEKELSKDNFTKLYSLLGSVLMRALDIIDRKKITLYQTKNSIRQLIEVTGSGFLRYKLYPNINYCPCEAFTRLVLIIRSDYTCKHVLASRLALALDQFTCISNVTNEDFDVRIKQLLPGEESADAVLLAAATTSTSRTWRRTRN